MPGQPGVETSVGAFVMPNAAIPDETPLTSFIVPGELEPSQAGSGFLHANCKSMLLKEQPV